MGRGHDEAFVTAREDLGHATGHLLPAIAVLVQRVLGLPVRPSDEQKRIAALERQLARARADRKDGRKAQAHVTRLEAELETARHDLAEAQAESARVRAECAGRCPTCRPAGSADRVLEVAARVLRASPPPGVDVAYLDAFLHRHRERLRAVVDTALANRAGGPQ